MGVDGLIEDLRFSTVLQSYQDDVRVILKAAYKERLPPASRRESNLGSPDQQDIA